MQQRFSHFTVCFQLVTRIALYKKEEEKAAIRLLYTMKAVQKKHARRCSVGIACARCNDEPLLAVGRRADELIGEHNDARIRQRLHKLVDICHLAKVDCREVREHWLDILEQCALLRRKGLREKDEAAGAEHRHGVPQCALGIRHQHKTAAEIDGIKRTAGVVVNALLMDLHLPGGIMRRDELLRPRNIITVNVNADNAKAALIKKRLVLEKSGRRACGPK